MKFNLKPACIVALLLATVAFVLAIDVADGEGSVFYVSSDQDMGDSEDRTTGGRFRETLRRLSGGSSSSEELDSARDNYNERTGTAGERFLKKGGSSVPVVVAVVASPATLLAPIKSTKGPKLAKGPKSTKGPVAIKGSVKLTGNISGKSNLVANKLPKATKSPKSIKVRRH